VQIIVKDWLANSDRIDLASIVKQDPKCYRCIEVGTHTILGI